MLRTGEKIGFYEVVAPLGAGGMGEVYRARDTRLRRDVAIKVLPGRLVRNQAAVERFRREAYAASALNHPNILTIFDIGRTGDLDFIATELVEGRTLREHIRERTLDLETALDIGAQAAAALHAAHEAGIVHRDIKPENIMVRQDGWIKVLDFGLAKLAERSAPARGERSSGDGERATEPGMILGTASYMSPEQARGLEVDTRSDLFSLGVVLYEMVAGRPPFGGETVSDVIASLLRAEPEALRALCADVPPELDLCLVRALRKDRRERFRDAAEFLSELKSIRRRLELDAVLGRSDEPLRNVSAGTDHATAILPADAAGPTRVLSGGSRDRIESLAVLPLVNRGGDAEAEYLADGITESIINCLSDVPELRVVPRSTVFRYKGRPEVSDDPQRIGGELGVCAVLSGQVVRIDRSLVVQAELIDVRHEAQIWGEQYRRRMTDIFVLQEEIACDISETLRLKVTGGAEGTLVKRYTDNTGAYRHYLKGRYFVTAKRTEEWIRKGIGYFQRAIDLDPNYALAYSGIAEAYGFLASSTGGWSPHEAYPKAKAAALKALELDDTLGEAHCSLGFFRLLYDWNFPEAEKQFRRAIELSPNYPNAYDGYGFYLKAAGRHAEAIEQCAKVKELDPLSPFSYISLGYGHYFAREYERAVAECEKALEMDRRSAFAYRTLGLALLQQGDPGEAVAALEKAVELSGGGPAFEAYLGLALGANGETGRAAEVRARLERLAERHYVPAYNLALVDIGAGDLDAAFGHLEKAFEERSGFMPFLNVEPLSDPLREDPRFERLIGRIGAA